MMKTMTAALIFGVLALSPGVSLAEEAGHSLEEVVVEMANTPAEHAALARHFRAKAEQARSEAQRHEGMARAYGAGKLTQRQNLKRHCQGLAEKSTAMAVDYEALAKFHEEEANP